MAAVRTQDLNEQFSATDRVEPPCKHFGRCGNCALQHIALPATREWKREQVRQAFTAVGIEIAPGETVATPLHSRRRVTLSTTREGDRIRLGYHERRSHDVFAVEECPVARPAIVAAIPALERIAQIAMRADLQVQVLDTEGGLDVHLARGTVVNEETRKALTSAAREAGIARLAVDEEVLIELAPPVVTFDTLPIVPPTGGFLQATAESETAMAERVSAHVGGSRKILDLFAGSGTFALRLARRGTVTAVESDARALEALTANAARNDLGSVTTQRRDLFERPIPASELNPFDAIVLDPPRAGAQGQCREIANSKVERVAYVSCNPQTLARDAKALIEGGYTLESVTPIDQFVWSTHIEAVALFTRPKRKKARRIFG